MPKFLKIKRVFGTPQANRIYRRTEQALLRERIHETRKNLANTDQQLLPLHLRLASSLDWSDWSKIDSLTLATQENTLISATKRQKEKYDRLAAVTLKTEKKTFMANTVVNLSDRQLTEEECSVLAKGANFAIVPDTVPVEEIISNVESSIRNLPQDVADEIRTEAARVLSKAKPPKSNLTSNEKKTIINLYADQNILILPADKGNATVIMKTEDYNNKIKELLDPNTYKKLKRDPTDSIVRKTNSLVKASSIEPDIQKRIIQPEALPPVWFT